MPNARFQHQVPLQKLAGMRANFEVALECLENGVGNF
jgi:hypothetical protein